MDFSCFCHLFPCLTPRKIKVTGSYLFIIQQRNERFLFMLSLQCKCTKVCRCMLSITKLSRVQLYLIEAMVFIWSIYEAGRNVLPKLSAGRALCWTQGWKTALFLHLSHDGMLRFSNNHPSTLKGLFDRSFCERSSTFWNVMITLKYVSSVFGGLHAFIIIQNGDEWIGISFYCIPAFTSTCHLRAHLYVLKMQKVLLSSGISH